MTAQRLGAFWKYGPHFRKVPLRVLVPVALILGLFGCGSQGTKHSPEVNSLPLAHGARIVAQQQKCDRGANAYCGWELVVVAPGYRSSDDLLLSERDQLKALGWTGANADIGGERAADSPGHKLHLTYGTAFTDLKGIDRGLIHRSRKITLTLSHTMLEQSPALSMLLELGSG
jgi:hypothetical protein